MHIAHKRIAIPEICKKPNMHFDVMKERNTADAPSAGSCDGENQKRQPSDQGNENYPKVEEFQAISREMRPPKKLEDRATQYQRKIV